MERLGSIENNITISESAIKTENFNWQLSDLLNNIDIGLFSRDLITDKYLNLSEGCCKIYGYSIHDFFNNQKLWFDVIYPDDKHIAEAEFQLLQKGQKSQSEYRIIHKNGSLRWIEVKVIPIIKDHKLIRADGIVTDITDRKEAELQIIKAKDLSEIIINSLPGIFYMYDKQGRFNYWNKNFEIVTGYTADEITSLHPLELFDDNDKALLFEKISHVFDSGPAEVEACLLTKDRRKIPFYFNGRKVSYDGVDRLVGMGIDITKRKNAEETLQKSEEMLSHILNSIPQSIFWKDKKSIFMGCNAVFANLAGLDNTASVVGKTDFDLPWAPEESKKYRKDDFEVMKTKQSKIHFVETVNDADNNIKWVDITKIPLKNENNKVYGILGIFDDITQRRLEEEKQQKINTDLIQKNIELRQFSYIVSHILRAPISKILGLASLFEKEKEVNPVNSELIEHLENEVISLDEVVRDLNAIVNAQDLSGKPMEEIFIYDELLDLKQTLTNEIDESGTVIKANFKSAEKLKSIRAYFYSIMYNLVSNAIKYRDPNKPLIVELETSQDDQFICLSVKDNGLGIDIKRYGDKLFGLYNRFHAGALPGKGIGLSLVKTQAETLGGRVELESKLGEGSVFKVYFPK